MNILPENYQVSNGYTVKSLIKQGVYNDTYRVCDESGKTFFLKIYGMDRTPAELLDSYGKVFEIATCSLLQHPNIVAFIDGGELDYDGVSCQYMITEYFTGGLLAEQISRGMEFDEMFVKDFITGILQALTYLEQRGLQHNDITPRNIMLHVDDSGKVTPKLIDFGHISGAVTGAPFFLTDDLSPVYRAPETFLGLYSPKSDMYSVGVVLYAMLYGKVPWNVDLSDCDGRKGEIKKRVREARAEGIDFRSERNIPEYLQNIIAKALSKSASQRFNSFAEMIAAFDNPIGPVPVQENRPSSITQNYDRGDVGSATASAEPAKDFGIKPKCGNGFADIAGMNDLKQMLQRKVIFVLNNKERAERYKITPPNGMLLYGPPGCGKTFFAEKFAEEAKFNFKFVKASDIASIYVHGSQGMIADLFKQAEDNKPVMLCFDEFDAMVPRRQDGENQSVAGEVNEFLSQLNNCAKRGIFVIGTSNRPDRIDPAVLRKGRIDTLVYVPLPDIEARKAMFELYLKDRPCENIDFDEIARITEKYVSSDIAYIANDAAMVAAFRDEPITQQTILDSIKSTTPSLNEKIIGEYEELRQKMENINREIPSMRRVGFVTD